MALPRQALIGVVGCPPLPGDGGYRGQSIASMIEGVLNEVDVLVSEGFDALMIQNIWSLPVKKQASLPTLTWMTRIAGEVRSRYAIPLGINVLEDDPAAMLAIADAVEAAFIRIKVYVGAMVGADGIREGSAAVTQSLRPQVGVFPDIYADVYDRTRRSLVDESFSEVVHHALWEGKADGLVVTGRSHEETLTLLRTARRQAPPRILVGGGATPETVGAYLDLADGVIVATYLKKDGQLLNSVDPERVRRLVAAKAQAID